MVADKNTDPKAHRTAVLGLLVYMAGVFSFGVLPLTPPPNELLPIEIIVGVLALVSAMGLPGKVYPALRLPWTRWAYQMCASTGTFTLLAFLALSDDAPPFVRLVYSLLLAAGALLGYGMYLTEASPKASDHE